MTLKHLSNHDEWLRHKAKKSQQKIRAREKQEQARMLQDILVGRLPHNLEDMAITREHHMIDDEPLHPILPKNQEPKRVKTKGNYEPKRPVALKCMSKRNVSRDSLDDVNAT